MKRKYIQPTIELVNVDNEISLVMMSGPPAPPIGGSGGSGSPPTPPIGGSALMSSSATPSQLNYPFPDSPFN